MKISLIYNKEINEFQLIVETLRWLTIYNENCQYYWFNPSYPIRPDIGIVLLEFYE